MKANLILTVLLFMFIGCKAQGPERMTSQQQETIKKEIREAVTTIFRNLEKMDADALFESYSNSLDFVFFTSDGSMADFQSAKNHHIAWFKSLSSLKVTPVKDEFLFLSDKEVVCSWLGKFEMTLSAGPTLQFDKFGITFIFKKLDNHWKVIHQHSSASSPAKDNPKN